MMSDTNLYRFGPYTVDIARRLLLRNGARVYLPQRAFDLLVILISNSGRVVTKDELMKNLWPDAFVEENNLTQTIYTLRKVLSDRLNEQNYIETVPRSGYRFNGSVVALMPDAALDSPDAAIEETEFPDSVRSASPIFAAIYSEATIAEREGLRRIAVIGYRNALEILIKDYARKKHPMEEEKIINKSLHACLLDYIDDDRIRSIVANASWLGSYGTHYVDEEDVRSLSDIKALILLLVHFFEMETNLKKLTHQERKGVSSLFKSLLHRR